MGNPHPAVTQARHALLDVFHDLAHGSHVVLAVSGGSDSMALAVSAVFAAKKTGITLHSLTVDHGIRAESACEAQLVQQWLEALGIDAHIATLRYPVGSDALGPEGGARDGRYQVIANFSQQLAQKSGEPVPVLLGHTANDQAETTLMGLMRGSGARSLSGMPEYGPLPVRPDVMMYRPLIAMRREDLRTVCIQLGVEWVDDPTNDADSSWRQADGSPLVRNAVRHDVMPVLERVFGKNVIDALGRTAQMLRDDDAALSAYSRGVLEKCVTPSSALKLQRASYAVGGRASSAKPCIDELNILCASLAQYPRAVRTRALRDAFSACGGRNGELVHRHIVALDKLVIGVDNNLALDLPGVQARRASNILSVQAVDPFGGIHES